MSSSILNKFDGDFDARTEYLVFGFIRFIKISNKIIPSSIIKLCIKFYYSSLRIICIKQVNQINQLPEIFISQFDINKYYETTIKPLADIPKWTKIDWNSAAVYIKNIKLPKKLISAHNVLSNKSIYDAVFLLGADVRDSHAFIIENYNNYTLNDNKEKINIYYWKLPLFSDNVMGSHVLYSQKYGLISIGNYKEKINGLNILDFNQYHYDDDKNKNKNNDTKWKWNEMNMERQRPQPSAAWINDNKFLCCGGYQHYHDTDLYDFENKKWTKLSNTQFTTRRSGICVDKLINKRVYIGGGWDLPKKFEYYDINKNKWFKLPKTDGQHKYHPIMWIENVNIIHIASVCSQQFEKIDLRQNIWSTYVSNDYKSRIMSINDVFGDKIPSHSSIRLCV